MKNVLIICQCATNKGDRAIAEYLIEQFTDMGNVEITLSTTEPTLWGAYEQNIKIIGTGYRPILPRFQNSLLRKIAHAIDSKIYDCLVYPNLMSLRGKHRICKMISKEFIKRITASDLVIVTGGHHITSIRNKNALFAITYDIGLASLYSENLVLWSQTIGPLEFTNHKARQFFERILSSAEEIYIRDDNSRLCLQNFRELPLNNVLKTYDSVFGFGEKDYLPLDMRQKKVGISIFNGLKKAFDTYPVLAQLLDYLVDKGYEIEFFRMEHNNKELEDIRAITALMKNQKPITIFPFLTTTQQHLAELSTCKCFIGYKTHSVIMSLATGTPLLGICYHKKTRDFMMDYGLERYALDDDDLSIDTAIMLINELLENGEAIHLEMAKKSKELAEQVRADLRRANDAK